LEHFQLLNLKVKYILKIQTIVKKNPREKGDKTKLKALDWNKIEPAKILNTIWEKDMDETEIEFDEINFKEEFSLKPTVVKSSKSAANKSTKKQKKCYCELDLQRNITIVLNTILKNLNPKDKEKNKNQHLTESEKEKKIVDLINKLVEKIEACETNDKELLTPNNIGLLIPILPSEAVFNKVSKESAVLETEEDYDPADLFIIYIGVIVGYKERFQSILFKSEYKDTIKNIEIFIDYFNKGFDFILNSQNLKKLFEIMLAIGNYMNGITNRGGAFGFKIDSLTKFVELKSKDNKTTLLNYIVDFIYEDLGNPVLIGNLLDNLKNFEQMEINSINELMNDLNKKFKILTTLKEKVAANKKDLDEDDQVENFLEENYEVIEKDINQIKKKVDQIQTKFEKVFKYLGEDKYDIEKFIILFKNFYYKLKEANDEYQSQKNKKHKKL
jgi:hypothetical protein